MSPEVIKVYKSNFSWNYFEYIEWFIPNSISAFEERRSGGEGGLRRKGLGKDKRKIY